MEYADLLITLAHHDNNPNNVTIAFTMGWKAAEKGHKAEILLLSDAVHLASQGFADKINIGEPFLPVQELIEKFISAGGTLKVCSACMIHNGVKEEQLIDAAQVVSADYVVDALMGAKKSLQLN
ncbi:hypothetical protein GCM10007425_02410 [Lysinibacillus alkalisoli]|uniref:Sulfur reduction protein DsrE n=1 Tax=Lysinibacillus alkalisoli TaxID=1911548 RepID=A0A917FXN1_9BACI|nr:DsrE family protein [Lysinibacillus alkalisoli]GGG11600.1 hypothetical protein GCM10007425_02410 [Lysinibacillus alkalisoli]